MSRDLVDPNSEVNPVLIEGYIRTVSNEIAKGVKIVSARLAAYRKAERDYELAFSFAYRAFDGPQTEKRHAAVVATSELRETRDDTEVVYKHAERAMSALEKELTAWQTINKTVTAMYGAAGTGVGY